MGSTGPRPRASGTAGYIEFDVLPVALAQLDSEFVVTEWNREAERLFGFGSQEVLGRRALDVLRSSIGNDERIASRAAISRGQPGRRVTDAITSSGRRIDIEIAMDPHLDATGAFTGGVLAFWDVTDREQAQLALAESERRFRLLLHDLPLPGGITDRDSRIVYVNRRLASLAGRSPDELEGLVWEDVYGAFEEDDRFWDAFLAGSVIEQYEGRVRTHDGSERLIAWMSVGIRDPDGELRMEASIGYDITDRRASELALAEASADRLALIGEILEAERAERARIAEALHDDTIQVLASSLVVLDQAMARTDGSAREQMARARESIAGAVERTRRMMFELRPALLEEAGLAGAIRTLCEHIAEDAGFRVQVRAPTARFAAPDEELCYRTVREAVVNAARHSRATVVEVSVEHRDRALEGRVADDGVGFDVAAPRQPDVARLHLGLRAMAERVRLAGGEVTVTSSPGNGTTVDFTVPVREV